MNTLYGACRIVAETVPWFQMCLFIEEMHIDQGPRVLKASLNRADKRTKFIGVAAGLFYLGQN